MHGPLGAASGSDRLQIRLYDLLAHGWDLAHATAQPARLPEDLAEQSLSFARGQVSDQARQGRFAPAQLMDGWVDDLRGSHVLEGCGHWTQQERPDEVNRILLKFLSSV